MIEMYVRLITNSEDWTIARVPIKHQADVLTELNKREYDGNGNLIVQ